MLAKIAKIIERQDTLSGQFVPVWGIEKNETASHLARQPHTNHIINNTKTNNHSIAVVRTTLTEQLNCKDMYCL